MDKDYYEILGVCESDSAETIKAAYRKLARKWHPDIAGNTPDVISRFKAINEAYGILSDNFKRTEYNKARSFYNYAKSGAKSESSTSAEYKQTSKDENKFASNPYFKNFSFDFEGLFGQKKNKAKESKAEKSVPKRGGDVYADLEITVWEAINGVEKVINMLQTTTCPKCGGRKFINGSLCDECKGKGEAVKHRKFTVKIPAGIKNGAKIRLAKEGGAGVNGGVNGDLYINVRITDSKEYKTEGLNIVKTVYITPFEAVLGATIDVKTLTGNYSVKIAPNTQNGQKIRLSGCGIVQNDRVGDMIIVLEIRIPKNLTTAEIELYRKLSEVSSSNIRESIYD